VVNDITARASSPTAPLLRSSVLELLGFSPEEPTVSGGNSDGYGLAGVFLRLLELPDRAVLDVIAVVIGETLAVGSAAVEVAGLRSEEHTSERQSREHYVFRS